MNWLNTLVVAHVIGTILGAGGSTFAELLYRQANRDKNIDASEAPMLRISYYVLRIGLVIIILSGFGLLLYFRFNDMEARLFSPKLWLKMLLVLVILVNAILMQTKRVPLWFGAAISISSWYTALILGAWGRLAMPFLWQLALYAAAVGIMLMVMHQLETRDRRRLTT